MSKRDDLVADVEAGARRAVDALSNSIQAEPEDLQGSIALAATMAALIGVIAYSPTPGAAVRAVLLRIVRDAQERGWLPPAPEGAATMLVFPADDEAVPPLAVRH